VGSQPRRRGSRDPGRTWGRRSAPHRALCDLTANELHAPRGDRDATARDRCGWSGGDLPEQRAARAGRSRLADGRSGRQRARAATSPWGTRCAGSPKGTTS
jgi:hypothetical protein